VTQTAKEPGSDSVRTGVAKEFTVVGKPPRIIAHDHEYMNAVEEWEEDWTGEDDGDLEDIYDSGGLGVPLSTGKPTQSAVLKS